MQRDLTQGPIVKTMLLFALPMMLGNLLQQCYNIADTLIVGRFLGIDALGAVGSSYALMTFLTSVLLGLCMGSGAVVSVCFGEKNTDRMKSSIFVSFLLTGAVALAMNLLVFLLLDPILHLMQVPATLYEMMREYVWAVFWGIFATFLYNYFACLLRAVGASAAPLVFLAISTLLNIGLDLLFVVSFRWGIAGAAWATVIAQFVSGIGLGGYTYWRFPQLRLERRHCRIRSGVVKQIAQFSFLTSLQQSVMNLGILMVQGLVNSFGAGVMAAFAAAVKVDSFAYMPVQDFGNAFSTFIAQNHGAGRSARIHKGIRSAVALVFGFCVVISAGVFLFARPLLTLFIDPAETQILSIGVNYLRIEGAFYFAIGFLFLFYGFFRAVEKPGVSVWLTVISLGTRVALAYVLSGIPTIGVQGIWWSVPIGWFLADLTGILFYRAYRKSAARAE